MGDPADDHQPPYYAVIFTSTRTPLDGAGYAEMAERMEASARRQPGFLGIESARGADGLGITVSYWRDLESVRAWGRVADHREAQTLGRSLWYESFRLRISRVESSSRFGFDETHE